MLTPIRAKLLRRVVASGVVTGGVVGVGVGVGVVPVALMVMVSDRPVKAPVLSKTSIYAVYVPALVGRPLITPLPERVRPGGRVPLAKFQL